MDSRTRIRVNAHYEAALGNRCRAIRAPKTAPSLKRRAGDSHLRSPASPTPWTRAGRRGSKLLLSDCGRIRGTSPEERNGVRGAAASFRSRAPVLHVRHAGSLPLPRASRALEAALPGLHRAVAEMMYTSHHVLAE